jgi:hypothetical protein
MNKGHLQPCTLAARPNANCAPSSLFKTCICPEFNSKVLRLQRKTINLSLVIIYEMYEQDIRKLSSKCMKLPMDLEICIKQTGQPKQSQHNYSRRAGSVKLCSPS